MTKPTPLRSARQRAGLTLSEVSAILRARHVRPSAPSILSEIETGVRIASATLVRAIRLAIRDGGRA